MREIYFVRHGESEWNRVGRLQGSQHGSSLSDLGLRQAETTGRLLADLELEALFSSPLTRARQTAEIVASHVSLPVTFDERLVEWDAGDWGGHLIDEVAERWPEEWAAFMADPFHYRGPNCENFPDMFERAAPFVEEVQASTRERIAVVSHGWIGKVMVSMLLGLEEEDTIAIQQANDVVIRVQADPGTDRLAADHYREGAGPFDGLPWRGGTRGRPGKAPLRG